MNYLEKALLDLEPFHKHKEIFNNTQTYGSFSSDEKKSMRG